MVRRAGEHAGTRPARLPAKPVSGLASSHPSQQPGQPGRIDASRQGQLPAAGMLQQFPNDGWLLHRQRHQGQRRGHLLAAPDPVGERLGSELMLLAVGDLSQSAGLPGPKLPPRVHRFHVNPRLKKAQDAGRHACAIRWEGWTLTLHFSPFQDISLRNSVLSTFP